jgi:hypothetical protein
MPCRDVPYTGYVRPRKLVGRRDLLSLLPTSLPLPAATPTRFGIETLRLKLGSDYREGCMRQFRVSGRLRVPLQFSSMQDLTITLPEPWTIPVIDGRRCDTATAL